MNTVNLLSVFMMSQIAEDVSKESVDSCSVQSSLGFSTSIIDTDLLVVIIAIDFKDSVSSSSV
jgi:hypothetical protein